MHIGAMEIGIIVGLVVAVVAYKIFKRLARPEVARSLGRAYGAASKDLGKAYDDVSKE